MMNQPPLDSTEASRPQTASGLAKASLTLGIIGIVTGCIGIGLVLALIGLILGIIALTKGKPGEPKGIAIAGTIIGGIGMIFVIPMMAIGMAIVLPALGAARRLARESNDRSNVIGLTKGSIIYAGSNHSYFPGFNSQGQFVTQPITAGPGVWTASPPSGGATTAANTGDFVMATLLNDGAVSPKSLINPSETNSHIVEAGNNGGPIHTTASGGNYSYALLNFTEPSLRNEWQDNTRANAILFGDRVLGTPGQPMTYSSVTTTPGSGMWKGALCYGDAHCDTQVGVSLQGLRYDSNAGHCPDIFATPYGWQPHIGEFGGLLWHGCNQ